MSGGRDIRKDLRKKPTGGVELIAVYTKGHPDYRSPLSRRPHGEGSIISNTSYSEDHSDASYLSARSPGSSLVRKNRRRKSHYDRSIASGTTIRDTGWYNNGPTADSDETIDEVGPFQDAQWSTPRYSTGETSHTQRKHTKSGVSYDTKTIVPKYPVARDRDLTEAALLWMKVRAHRGKQQADARFFHEEDEAGCDMNCAGERYCSMRDKVSKFEKDAFQGQRRSVYDDKDGDEEEEESEEESFVSFDVSGIERWRSMADSGKARDSRNKQSFSQAGLGPSARSVTRASRYGGNLSPYRPSERIFSIGPSLSDVGSICPDESASNVGIPRSYRGR